MATLKDIIKSWFETGKTPTQEQFWAWLDSYFHKDEKIPITTIDDIDNILNAKADAEALTNHDLQAVLEAGKSYSDANENNSIKVLEDDGIGNIKFEINLRDEVGLRTGTFFINSEGNAVLSTRSEDKFAIISLINGLLKLTQVDETMATNVEFEKPLANTVVKFPAKPAGTYTLATTADVAGGGSPYKVYTGLISQSGTNNPTVFVQQSTLTTPPTITRLYVGYYELDLVTPIWTKIFVILTPTSLGTISSEIDGSIVRIRTQELNAAPYVNSDNILNATPIEIRVYN